MSIVLKRLTEEEIKKLPFPETARKIGGILEFRDDSITEKDCAKIRKAWQATLASSKPFKKPTFKKGKKRGKQN